MSAVTEVRASAAADARGGLCALLGLDRQRVAELVMFLADGRMTVAAAESLTAGLFTAALTEIPGSSAVLRGGIVCYATDLKHSLVGVDDGLLARVGPVDREVAVQLAAGARDRCGASIGVGLTGVAGPDAQDGVAPGTVFVAAASADRFHWRGLTGHGGRTDRWGVRAAAVRTAIELIEEMVTTGSTG